MMTTLSCSHICMSKRLKVHDGFLILAKSRHSHNKLTVILWQISNKNKKQMNIWTRITQRNVKCIYMDQKSYLSKRQAKTPFNRCIHHPCVLKSVKLLTKFVFIFEIKNENGTLNCLRLK